MNPENQVSSWSYDAASRVTANLLANGTQASYTYDNANRLLLLANLTSGGTTLSSFNYTYNSVGDRTQVVEADGSVVSWSYDPTYQLTNEQRSGANAYNITYAYDGVGNRTLLLNGGAATTSTYNAANELATSQSSAGVTTFAYDGDGNLLTSQAPANQWTTNTWDGENRLTQVALPSAIVDSFTYNGDGQRVQKQDSTGTTNHVWDGQNILLETNASNIIQVVYTLEALPYGDLISQSRGGVDSFYLFDAMDSARQLAGVSGAVTDSYLYDSWGNILAATGSSTNWLRYSGRVGYYWDIDPAKCYVRARIYDSQTGRWLSRDPTALGNSRARRLTSSYGYADNSPITSTDPSGLDPVARPQPEPPNWFWGNWGYGWYCGAFRMGPLKWRPPLPYFPPIQPIDPLDAACKAHDNCLRTPWLFLTNQCWCNFWLCNAARAAESSWCAGKYLRTGRLDWRGNPIMDWRGYDNCIRAASEIQSLYCTITPPAWFD